MSSIKVGFFGMTHLGLISAVAAASKYFDVIGFDQDYALVQRLQQRHFPVEEPQLSEMVAGNASRLHFTAQIDELLKADIIYIAIDVPTDADNNSNLQPISNALELLRPGLRDNQIVIVLSQVCPGFTRNMNFPSHQLFYQVETLVFGCAIERATLPERFIVGCAHPSEELPINYRRFLQAFNCPIFPMRYESAELAKISINMYLVASVMTSNMLAEVATVVGAEWQEIIPTLRLDKRIGQYAYLNPGLGISGGNLERDILTVMQEARRHGALAELARVWLDGSRYYKDWVFRCVQTHILSTCDYPIIALLGLAYKPNTHSIKNSPSIELIKHLNCTNALVQTHDPVVEKQDIPEIKHCSTTAEALNEADALIIMTPWSAYSHLSLNDLMKMRGRIIIDPFRVLSHADLIQAGFTVLTLGVKYSPRNQLSKETVHA